MKKIHIQKYNHEELTHKKISNYKILGLLLIIVCGSFFIGLLSGSKIVIDEYKKGVKNSIDYEEALMIVTEQDSFTERKLVDYLIELNIKFPDIVFAQARYESGNFGSRIFLENHNLFGMKVANVRATTALGEQYGHAYYSNWKQSVLDYALYQNAYTRKLKTREEYMTYLKNYYAEGTYESIQQIMLETQKKYPELFVTYPKH
jgi:hypothetical protein